MNRFVAAGAALRFRAVEARPQLHPAGSPVIVRWRSSTKARSNAQQQGNRNATSERSRLRVLSRLKGLHPAAKWKRILSASDFWFSKGNLQRDAFLQEELRRFGGWCRVRTLLTFPKFHAWTTAQLLVDAYASSEGCRRYALRDPGAEGSSLDASRALVCHRRMDLSRLDGIVAEPTEAKGAVEGREVQGGYAEKVEALPGSEDNPDPFGYRIGRAEDTGYARNGGGISTSLRVSSQSNGFSGIGRPGGAGEPQRQRPQQQRQQLLPVYASASEVVVARTPGQVRALVVQLRRSLAAASAAAASASSISHKTNNDGGGCAPAAWPRRHHQALGFDVEYCSLEMDIRNDLPAMLQLAAPGGPVGLIWLDKLPDRGRGIFTDPELEPLYRLLADPAVLKVGCGVAQDGKRLAAWCGVASPNGGGASPDGDASSGGGSSKGGGGSGGSAPPLGHFLAGLTELAAVAGLTSPRRSKPASPPPPLPSLAALCEAVLGRRLSKRKTGSRSGGSGHGGSGVNDRRGGRSDPAKRAFWRAPVLTNHMARYAAHDACAALDVWLGLTFPISGMKRK